MMLKSLKRVSLFTAFALLLMFAAAAPSQAQEEGVPTVVDEVIAQVNDQVITLSMLKREAKEATDALKQRGGMTEQQASDEVKKNQPRMVANLVDEQLILQKGKEIPRLSEDIEAEVNREMIRVMKAQNFKTLEELEAAMRAAGIEPADIRQTLRNQFMRQAVLQREVDAKVYFGLTSDEIKKFYEANRAKFAQPESIELSEIYLSLAGKTEAEVKAKAEQLVAQARGGADFGALAAANSEREQEGKRVAPETKGKVGRYELSSLRPEIAAAVKTLVKGGVSDPVRFDEGYQIIRIDERTPASESKFNEEQARGALTQERAEKERGTYIDTLRREAYIKLAKDYEASVMPLLKIDKPVTDGKPVTPVANDKKPAEQKSPKPGDQKSQQR